MSRHTGVAVAGSFGPLLAAGGAPRPAVTGDLHILLRRSDARAIAVRVAAALHRPLYRWSSGRLGGTLRGGAVLLLTTRGRKTGKSRTSPVCCVVDGDRLVVAAAAAGRPRHPAWYLNLRDDPRVGVQLGAVRRTMVATRADGSERERLWERLRRQYPVCEEYQRRTRRSIPVVVLRPVGVPS